VLRCAVLQCAVLRCAVLRCAVLRCAVLRCAVLRCAVLASVLGTASVAKAQILPEEPISLAAGHVVFGGEATATIAPDDPGFFNYTSYEYSALRNLRLGLSTEIRATDRFQFLAEVRFDQGRVLEAYGLFVRVRPFPSKRFDIQAGRVPPTFGAMSRTSYGSSNILIGQPLAYQYLVSIRPDALPATNDDLLRMRGRGWESSFPVGNTTPGPGLPFVNTSEWDTGVQAHGVTGMVDWSGAITTGSLSDPRFHDNNHGRQYAGRAVVRPIASTAIGISLSRGDWLDGELEDSVTSGAEKHARQTAIGGDAEFSAGPFLVRGEVIRSMWDLPVFGQLHLADPIAGVASLIEGRYKIAPGLYVALRADRLDFSRIEGTRGLTEWEADTWRVETGVGYSVRRNILVKGAWQYNDRDGGRVRNDGMLAAQVLYWF
jgi:hypothetical protein